MHVAHAAYFSVSILDYLAALVFLATLQLVATVGLIAAIVSLQRKVAAQFLQHDLTLRAEVVRVNRGIRDLIAVITKAASGE